MSQAVTYCMHVIPFAGSYRFKGYLPWRWLCYCMHVIPFAGS